MSTEAPLTFRTATPADAPTLAAHIQTAFRASDPRPDWTADEATNAGFNYTSEQALETITNPDAVFLLAHAPDGTLMASIAAIRRSSTIARLAMVAVDQKRQRGGLGRRVVEAAEAWAIKEWGVSMLGLNVLEGRDRLREFYERRGFVLTGEISVVEVAEGRLLRFVEMEKVL